ncbi:MAG: IclR family transcriptional regulator [Gammaproteobacteria bacterium]|nr:IclR family transcriptional regulator [Gammaproteobacteria bacterium]
MPDSLSPEATIRRGKSAGQSGVGDVIVSTAGNTKGSTVTRVLDILEAVAVSPRPLTPTELSESLNIPKASIHRLCSTLESEGYLQTRLSGRGLLPGHRFQKVALGAMASSAHRAEQHAILVGLSRRIGETCNISVPDGSEMIYFDRAETHWPVRVQLKVGSRVPAHCTAAGKMFLSSLASARRQRILSNITLDGYTENTLTDVTALEQELESTRLRGYSTDNQEYIDGMVALAVAVTDQNDRLFATLSFHAPTMRIPFESLKDYLPEVQSAGLQLSELLNV